jgi:hypothetical protein
MIFKLCIIFPLGPGDLGGQQGLPNSALPHIRSGLRLIWVESTLTIYGRIHLMLKFVFFSQFTKLVYHIALLHLQLFTHYSDLELNLLFFLFLLLILLIFFVYTL